MTFTPNIPLVGQSLGSSRTQVLGNFTNYNNLVSIDHVAPNSPNQGQHKQVSFNGFGTVGGYAVSGNQSFLSSFSGSNSGSNLIYQPSVVAQTTKVPVTVRAIARASFDGANWTTSANGPYGANSTFNIGTISGTSTTVTVPFSNDLADDNYFVMTSIEKSSAANTSIAIANKTTAGFDIKLGAATTGMNIAIMVY